MTNKLGKKQKKKFLETGLYDGAGEGTRTLDILLGRQELYH